MRRITTAVLSVLLVMLPVWAAEVKKAETAGSLDEIQKKYPGAKLKTMSLEEYGLMKALYDDMGKPYPGTERVSSYEDNRSVESSESNTSEKTVASQEDNASESDETAGERPERLEKSAHVGVQHVHLDLPDIDGSGDSALVVLVVIGVIVVAVLVVYAGKYLYDVATSNKKYDYWMDMGWTYTYFSSEATYNAGSMSGVKFSTGFKDGSAKIGMSAEAGAFAFKLDGAKEFSWVEYGGSYAMAGPHVRFESGPNTYVYLELLGGKSSHESVDTLALGRFGIQALIGRVTAGINIGAIYMGLEDAEGIAKDADNYETTTGFEIGYSF